MKCFFYQNFPKNIEPTHFSSQINQFPIQQAYSIPNSNSNPSSPILPNVERCNNNERFSLSICSFVSMAELKSGSLFTFTDICSTYNIQRRRLYDVINALEAIGCCRKTSVDTIIWEGLSFIPERIKNLFKSLRFDSPDVSIDVLISNEASISILQLSQSFVLLFIVLQKQALNIKSVAKFLSKKNGRLKTTLCKLYQIAHIFETLGIFQKSVIPGQIILLKKYYFEYQIKDSANALISSNESNNQSFLNSELNPLSIQNLLSRPKESGLLSKLTLSTQKVIENRNKDFELSVYQEEIDTQYGKKCNDQK